MKTALLWGLPGPAMAGPDDRTPSDGHVSEELLGQALGPITAALAEAGAVGIVMRRPVGSQPAIEALQDRIGNLLDERGYQIWTVPARADLPEDALLLDLEVVAAGFDYPARRTGFLGLGPTRVLRRGALGLSGRLEDPTDGRWLWSGSPRLVREDWITDDSMGELRADRPLWMSAKPLPEVDRGTVWWERGIVAGLMAGVIILYTDGTR